MQDFKTAIAESFELLGRNRKFVLLYVCTAVIFPVFDRTVVPRESSVIFILAVTSFIVLPLFLYIDCGLLGSLKEDIVNGRSSTFKDFHTYAKKYIFRVFGIDLISGLIVSIPLIVIAVYKLVMSFNSIEDPTWMVVVMAVRGALMAVWSAGAVCYAVYHDKGIFESLKGGLSAVYENRRFFIILFVLFLLSSVLYSSVLGKPTQEVSVLARYFVSTGIGIIQSSATVLAYAYVMLSFRKAAQLPAAPTLTD